MKRFDIVIIIGILIVAGGFYFFNWYRTDQMNTDQIVAKVYVDGEIYDTLPINQDKKLTIETEFGRNVVSVHDHGVEMVEANCPDHLCEKIGFVNQIGNQIVCLPNRVYVEIVGHSEEQIDAISE